MGKGGLFVTPPLEDSLTGLTGSSTRAWTGCTDLQLIQLYTTRQFIQPSVTLVFARILLEAETIRLRSNFVDIAHFSFLGKSRELVHAHLTICMSCSGFMDQHAPSSTFYEKEADFINGKNAYILFSTHAYHIHSFTLYPPQHITYAAVYSRHSISHMHYSAAFIVAIERARKQALVTAT